MAITVRAVGTVAAGTGAISPGMPAGVLLNDILLLFIESAIANGAVTGGTETWTQVADSPQDIAIPDNSARARLSVYWARASQNSPTSPTVGAATNHQQGVIIAFAGGMLSGNPYSVTSGGTEQGPDTSISITGDTTTVNDCLIVIACATSLPDANSTTEFSGLTNADLTSLTERVDNTTLAGNGGGLFVATGIKATAGTYGATSVTAVTSAAHAFMTIALCPDGVVLGTGALVSGATDITGAGISASTSTDGAIAAGATDITGAGASASTGTGALISGAADVTGAGISASTSTDGAIAAGAADINAAGFVTWSATAALIAGATDITGAGESASTGTGGLIVGDCDIDGDGLSASSGTGFLAIGDCLINGLGVVELYPLRSELHVLLPLELPPIAVLTRTEEQINVVLVDS